MKFRVKPKPFNALIKSAKTVIGSNKALSPASFQIHIRVFSTAPGVWYMQAAITDGYRVHEDVIELIDVQDETGPAKMSIDIPRLVAKSPVTIESDFDKITVSFDDVTFTTKTEPALLHGEPKDPEQIVDKVIGFANTVRTKDVQKENRISICCNPKYLAGALAMFTDGDVVRLDIGSEMEPIIITGATFDTNLFRVIMPKRSSVSDKAYRERVLKYAPPDAKPET